MEGVWNTWFDGPNKQLMTQQTFVDGAPQGVQTYWFEDGQTKLEVEYDNGAKEGPWQEWYPNGQLRAKGSYSKGKPDGELAFWREDGSQWSVKSYQDGKRHGQWQEWDAAGNLISSQRYEKGIEVSER
jgi:antitoxin component YwqK of YwqJK toxin-antitoxin module